MSNSTPHYLSYEDLLRAGVLSDPWNCLQYCIDVGLLRDKRFCTSCQQYMGLEECLEQKYNDGYCWRCPGGRHYASVRSDSLLASKEFPLSKFIQLLWLYCNYSSVSQTAGILSMCPKKIRSMFKAIRQCMAEDMIDGSTMIGGPGEIVEIDDSKFGKRKYNRGRRVMGKWVLGGIQRGSGNCFLVECSDNRRDHNTLTSLIKQHVRRGTTIITDKWKGYVHLDRHGYNHFDVNHSRNFVDPVTGAHTNMVEGMWFHTKRNVKRGHGNVRTDSNSLSIALYEYMWQKKHGITRSSQDVRRMFSKEIPLLMERIFEQ